MPSLRATKVLTSEDLDCAAEVAKACGAWVLSDEIYSRR